MTVAVLGMVPAVWLLARFRPRGRRVHPVQESLSWWQSASVLVLYGSIFASSVHEIRLGGQAPPPVLAVLLVAGLVALAATRYVFTFGPARKRHRNADVCPRCSAPPDS